MKPTILRKRHLLPALAFLTSSQWQAQAGISGPYTADEDTAYLFHFDESAGSVSAANAGFEGFPAIPFDGATEHNSETDPYPLATGVMGARGPMGFGRAADLSG